MTWAVIITGIAIILLLGWSRILGGWKIVHQKIIGISLIAYGAYLATLTGTLTQFVVPGMGAVGVGASRTTIWPETQIVACSLLLR